MKDNGPSATTHEQLHSFFEANKTVPEDSDVPFCIDFFIELKKGKADPNKLNEDDLIFSAIFTTKRLLENTLNAHNIHVDGTYKLNYENYPLLVFGTTDKERKFHLIALAISSNENTAAFEFCFESLEQSVADLFIKSIPAEVLVSDACEAIKVAFRRAFPNAKEVTCWFHVKKNVETRLRSSPNKEQIMADIRWLQLCSDINVFRYACGLFIEEWINIERDFIRYFQKQWLKEGCQNWFEGFMNFTPSTNNSLEATNKRLKDDFNLRSRCMLSSFKGRLFAMLMQYSQEYRDNKRAFKLFVALNDQAWKEGIEWAKSGKSVITEADASNKMDHYFVPTGDAMVVSSESVDVYKALAYDSFDDFYTKHFKLWRVSMSRDRNHFDETTCTCPVFFKMYTCKHMIGMGLRMKHLDIPAAINLVGGRRRRKGRPLKIGPALSKT